MTNLMSFDFNGSIVRTEKDSNDQVWFCAADVAKAIDHSDTYMMLKMLEKDDTTLVCTIDTLGRQQQVNFISESGLYTILFRSDLPKCKPFQKWLSSEVLPSIRKTGGYKHQIKDPVLAAMYAQIEQLDQLKQRQQEQQQALGEVQECLGDTRLTSSQIAEIDSLLDAKYRSAGLDGRLVGRIKARIKETFLTPPLSTKTFKDCAQKDYNAILQLIRNF